jgi:hypothetical protein
MLWEWSECVCLISTRYLKHIQKLMSWICSLSWRWRKIQIHTSDSSRSVARSALLEWFLHVAVSIVVKIARAFITNSIAQTVHMCRLYFHKLQYSNSLRADHRCAYNSQANSWCWYSSHSSVLRRDSITWLSCRRFRVGLATSSNTFGGILNQEFCGLDY